MKDIKELGNFDNGNFIRDININTHDEKQYIEYIFFTTFVEKGYFLKSTTNSLFLLFIRNIAKTAAGKKLLREIYLRG